MTRTYLIEPASIDSLRKRLSPNWSAEPIGGRASSSTSAPQRGAAPGHGDLKHVPGRRSHAQPRERDLRLWSNIQAAKAEPKFIVAQGPADPYLPPPPGFWGRRTRRRVKHAIIGGFDAEFTQRRQSCDTPAEHSCQRRRSNRLPCNLWSQREVLTG